jgi:hypothetical protein
MGDGVHLMRPQRDFRVDAGKLQMASVILPGTDTVELLVVEPDQPLAPVMIVPYPSPERVLDLLLLLLCNRGFLPVQDAYFFTIRVDLLVKNADILEVERLFDDLIGVDAIGTKGDISQDAVVIGLFPFDAP